jgi:hypothetical protein
MGGQPAQPGEKMRVTACLAVLLAAVALDAFASEEKGAEFRGYVAVNRAIRERIVSDPEYAFGKALNSEAPRVKGLFEALGTYSGSDTDARFRNGEPNSANMLIWYVSIYDLAREVGRRCEPARPKARGKPKAGLKLRPRFEAALSPICAWPAKRSMDEGALQAFWGALMAYDAPPEEFVAWKEPFLRQARYKRLPPGQVVSEMILSALMSPYFLLKS